MYYELKGIHSFNGRSHCILSLDATFSEDAALRLYSCVRVKNEGSISRLIQVFETLSSAPQTYTSH